LQKRKAEGNKITKKVRERLFGDGKTVASNNNRKVEKTMAVVLIRIYVYPPPARFFPL
jgi:hypothetical protein